MNVEVEKIYAERTPYVRTPLEASFVHASPSTPATRAPPTAAQMSMSVLSSSILVAHRHFVKTLLPDITVCVHKDIELNRTPK